MCLIIKIKSNQNNTILTVKSMRSTFIRPGPSFEMRTTQTVRVP